MDPLSFRSVLRELARFALSALLVVGGLCIYFCYGYSTGQGPDLDGGFLFGCLKGLAAAAAFTTSDWPVVWFPAALLYAATIFWRFSRTRLSKAHI